MRRGRHEKSDEQAFETAIKTLAFIDQQVSRNREIWQETAIDRFDALSEVLRKNDKFRHDLTPLNEEILKNAEKRFPASPTPAKMIQCRAVRCL